jgi:hypothetical protein
VCVCVCVCGVFHFTHFWIDEMAVHKLMKPQWVSGENLKKSPSPKMQNEELHLRHFYEEQIRQVLIILSFYFSLWFAFLSRI